MLTFIRRTPSAFWIALLGVGLFLCVFFSGIWGEMTPFALIFLVPAYLLVAFLTAYHNPGAWTAAIVFATLIAVFEVGAALVFLTGNGTEKPIPETALIHATGAVIAVAAAVSALLAVRTSKRSSHIGVAG